MSAKQLANMTAELQKLGAALAVQSAAAAAQGAALAAQISSVREELAAQVLSAVREELLPLREEVRPLRAEIAELRPLRGEVAELRPLCEEMRPLRAEVAELRELLPARKAARKARERELHRHNFISALICTAENGYGRDVEPFLALCRETWGEERLWDAVKDLPHGCVRREGPPTALRGPLGSTSAHAAQSARG